MMPEIIITVIVVLGLNCISMIYTLLKTDKEIFKLSDENYYLKSKVKAIKSYDKQYSEAYEYIANHIGSNSHAAYVLHEMYVQYKCNPKFDMNDFIKLMTSKKVKNKLRKKLNG